MANGLSLGTLYTSRSSTFSNFFVFLKLVQDSYLQVKQPLELAAYPTRRARFFRGMLGVKIMSAESFVSGSYRTAVMSMYFCYKLVVYQWLVEPVLLYSR
jgi:hypothetical protein